MTRDEFEGKWVRDLLDKADAIEMEADLDALLAAKEAEVRKACARVARDKIMTLLRIERRYLGRLLPWSLDDSWNAADDVAAAIRDSAAPEPAGDGLNEEALMQNIEETADEFTDFMKRTVPKELP